MAKCRLTFYASRLGLVTGSQAKLGLKVSSPYKSHMWKIPCTLLGLTIKSVGCHAALNAGWRSESVGNCISLAAWG